MRATFSLFLLVASVAHAQGAAPEKRGAVRFTLDPDRRVYEVGTNISYQTTIWTPVDCFEPAIGDPEYFVVLYNPKLKAQRRFVVTPQIEKLGASTNLTIDCEENVRLVLKLTQVPPDHAALSVEFEFDSSENARVRAAVADERKRGATECDGKIDSLRSDLEKEAIDRLVRGLLRRFSASDDVEYGRQNFVIVKAFQQVLIGTRGYLVFQVQNRTDNVIVVKEADVLDASGGHALENVELVMPERRVGPDSIAQAVVAFDSPEALKAVTLVVREDGPREIRVEEIDF